MDGFKQRLSLVRLYLLFLVYFGAFVASNARNNCSCYIFFQRKPKSWNNSQVECSTNGGNLVSMETKGEWQFVNMHVQQRNFSNNEWYIGLTNYTGQWMWNSDRMLTIKKWQTEADEPNGDGKCAAMAKNYPPGTTGLFKDMDCLTTLRFICEYDEKQAICRQMQAPLIYCSDKHVYTTKTTNVTATGTASPSSNTTVEYNKASRTVMLAVVSVLGVVLLVCIVVFIYVFGWWAYEPGYEGYGLENCNDYINRKKYSPMLDSPSVNVSLSPIEEVEEIEPESARDERMRGNWADIDDDDEHVGSNDDDDEHVGSNAVCPENQDGESSDLTNTILHAQVHKTLSETLPAEAVNSSSRHESSAQSKSYPRDLDEGLHNPKQVEVVYAQVKKVKLNSSGQSTNNASPLAAIGRQRSNSACAIAPEDDEDASIETRAASQRRQTWTNRFNRQVEVDTQSSARSGSSNEKEIPQAFASGVSRDSKVIYATVDKSKKTKRPANQVNIVSKDLNNIVEKTFGRNFEN